MEPLRPSIDRASSSDLLALASDLPGSPAVVAAIIRLGPGPVDVLTLTEAIGNRILDVPRLRQRLVPTPFGCGRKIWVDDDHFDLRHHVRAISCPSPGDEAALLEVAAECVTEPLRLDRPLWSGRVVSGLSGGGTAMILVMHHVLADGIGGLAILAQLVDGAPPAPRRDYPRPAPSGRSLLLDTLHARFRAVVHATDGAARLRAAVRELAPHGIVRSPASSLNRPTGSRRRLAVVTGDLPAVQRTAHALGATVNDVVLAAVTGALHAALIGRNEIVDQVVVSVPISARRATSAAQLGNDVGAIPIPLPCTGDLVTRLAAISTATRTAKTTEPGSSAALLAPAFRALAALGLLRWFLDRQRLITTFVTNVRGPAIPLRFLGLPVTAVIPVSPITGNVTVAFAAFSYAGTLTITVVADPARWPDLSLLVVALQRELDEVAAMR